MKSRNIVQKFLSVIMMTHFSIFAVAHAEGRAGNGGDGVVINNRLYLLDLVESNIHTNPYFDSSVQSNTRLANDLQRSLGHLNGLNLDKLNRKIEEIITKVDPALGSALVMAITAYQWSLTLHGIVDVQDEDSVLQFGVGLLRQFAIRRDNNIYISQSSWNLANEDQKIALVLHEALYAIAPYSQGEGANARQSSPHVRTIIGQLFRQNYNAIYIRGMLNSYGFISGPFALLSPNHTSEGTNIRSLYSLQYVTDVHHYNPLSLFTQIKNLNCDAFINNNVLDHLRTWLLPQNPIETIPVIYGQLIPFGHFPYFSQGSHLSSVAFNYLGIANNYREIYFQLNTGGYQIVSGNSGQVALERRWRIHPSWSLTNFSGSSDIEGAGLVDFASRSGFFQTMHPLTAFSLEQNTLPEYFGNLNMPRCRLRSNIYTSIGEVSNPAILMIGHTMSRPNAYYSDLRDCLQPPREWTTGAANNCRRLANEPIQTSRIYRQLINHFDRNNIRYLDTYLDARSSSHTQTTSNTRLL